MKNWAVVGRVFFAVAVIGSGLMQLIHQNFVRLVPALPGWAGGPVGWAILSGVILVAAGVALIVGRKQHLAAAALAGLFVLVFLLFIPGVMANPKPGYMWTNPCKTLALFGGAILLLGNGSKSSPQSNVPERQGWRWHLAAIFYGLFFVVGGIQHHVYLDFVTQLVPGWMPQRSLWARFTGIALIAGGLGINFRPTARPAAVASGVMVFLWVILLHIPRALSTPAESGETAAIFEALALSGTAFLLAGTVRTR